MVIHLWLLENIMRNLLFVVALACLVTACAAPPSRVAGPGVPSTLLPGEVCAEYDCIWDAHTGE